MKKMLIAGNWKMHTNAFESVKLIEYIYGGIKDKNLNCKVLVCPPFTSLYPVSQVLKGSKVLLGAQNCHEEIEGAYTGEISVRMLRNIGCSHVIIGHSERRTYFGETNDLLNKKLKVILERPLSPIFCIGETLEERRAGNTFDVLSLQLEEGLDGIEGEDFERTVIAYEPVWAIGTGVAATDEQVKEAHDWLRGKLAEMRGEAARETILLYGGSMKPKNAESLLSIDNVNGGLIGGASLDPESFLKIIESAESVNK